MRFLVIGVLSLLVFSDALAAPTPPITQLSTGWSTYSHGRGTKAVRLQDGRVLVVGGLVSGDGYIAENQLGPGSIEIFDRTTHVWTPLPVPAFFPLIGHDLTLLGDGRVLLTGGLSDSLTSCYPNCIGWTDPAETAWLFDPTTDSWSQTNDPNVYMWGFNNQHILLGGKEEVMNLAGRWTYTGYFPTSFYWLGYHQVYDSVPGTWGALKYANGIVNGARRGLWGPEPRQWLDVPMVGQLGDKPIVFGGDSNVSGFAPSTGRMQVYDGGHWHEAGGSTADDIYPVSSPGVAACRWRGFTGGRFVAISGGAALTGASPLQIAPREEIWLYEVGSMTSLNNYTPNLTLLNSSFAPVGLQDHGVSQAGSGFRHGFVTWGGAVSVNNAIDEIVFVNCRDDELHTIDEMTDDRRLPTVVHLSNSEVLVFGGLDGNSNPLDTYEIWRVGN